MTTNEEALASYVDRQVQIKLAAARGGFDASSLTIRGIMGDFKDVLENLWDNTWASQTALTVSADAESVTHGWMGQPPPFRQWLGGLNLVGMNPFEITITNKDYEASTEVSLHDLRRDKTGGTILAKLGQLAQRAHQHVEELLVADVIVANATAYDSVALFAASHVIGGSGTLSNLLTVTDLPGLNVATAARPTREEAAVILTQAVAYFFRMKDDQGRKANQGAKKFLLLCPVGMAAGFQQAINSMLYVTGGSPTVNTARTPAGAPMEIAVVPEPLLDDEDTEVCYLFRTDAPGNRPLIYQTEVDPHVRVIGEDSEHAIKNNAIVFTARATRGVAPGEWRQALKLTLS